MKEQPKKHVEVERKEKDKRGKHKEHCNRLNHRKERRPRNWKFRRPSRTKSNDTNVKGTNEGDRTETFQTPNARVATDTQAENKKEKHT